jgi:uncharacterized protein YaaW (UPF0174 family)
MDELTAALELSTDEELRYLAEILFRRKFNPLDYITTPEVLEVQSWERQELIDAIAIRFRFLAADGFTVLKGKSDELSYRRILERVCRYLKVSYSKTQTVAEIESELFLHMLSRSWQTLSPSEQRQLNQSMQSALTEADLHKTLPANFKGNVGLLLKGSGAIAVSTVVQPAVMHLLARKFAMHLATYQVGREAIKAGGTAIAAKVQAIFSTQMAKQGMAVATARYGVARTAFAFLTPTLWGLFFADLGWRAIATNYGRIIPVIFTLAQIRLLREI